MSATTATENVTTAPMTIELAVEQGKRAYALQKYEQAIEAYAQATELMTAKHGEDATETAELYFMYGRALLANAVSQNNVLGKKDEEGDEDSADEAADTGAIMSFGGDAEEDEGAVSGAEDPAVDLFAQAKADLEAEEAEEKAAEEAENDEDADEEPEDDFALAWEVLDLARTIYDKHQASSDEFKLKLADTYMMLGDVSLETEKFDQAITDYNAGLKVKTDLLPESSRQIAEAHYKLAIVLDLTSGRLSDAISHGESALSSIEARITEINGFASGELKAAPEAAVDVKGKGKATKMVADDAVSKLSKEALEAELKEVKEIRDELVEKIEELKSAPQNEDGTAPDLAAQALDAALGRPVVVPSAPAPVNDLTSIVKKKKKPVVAEEETNGASGTKRKADDDEGSDSAKKTKTSE